MHSFHLSQGRMYAMVMMTFAAILFLAVFPVFLLIGFVSALAIAVCRGSAYVSWRPPSDCITPLSWAASEWNYQGLGGKQTGMRALGLEVAYNGMLHKA